LAAFFIDIATGQAATGRQLAEAGILDARGRAPRPWHPIQGTGDASTLWYAVMRKQVKDVYIGALCLRHSEHHASLMQQGWQEIPVDEIGAGVTRCTPAR
jgi:hypothetical protein